MENFAISGSVLLAGDPASSEATSFMLWWPWRSSVASADSFWRPHAFIPRAPAPLSASGLSWPQKLPTSTRLGRSAGRFILPRSSLNSGQLGVGKWINISASSPFVWTVVKSRFYPVSRRGPGRIEFQVPAVVTYSFVQNFIWVSSLLASFPHSLNISLDYLPNKLPSPRSSAQGWLWVIVKARHSVCNRSSQSLKSGSIVEKGSCESQGCACGWGRRS